MAYKLLIVDDEPANLRLLERLFRRDYDVITASSGAEALDVLAQHDIPLVITDQRMPGMTGIELLKSTVTLRPHMVRIILTGYTDVSALVEAINCGHVYKYVTKPWSNDELRLTVSRALEHYETTRSRHELDQANRRLLRRLRETTRGAVRAIADALEAKDEYVYGHSRRVAGYATAVARRMRLDVARLEELSLAALLHDIGKIGTPDALLLKPGALTEEERSAVRLHPELGARILGGIPEMEDVAEIVLRHHENYDGTGYPGRLAGERIPLASRIVHVADAYDAMTSPRPFRDAFDHHEAVARLRADAGAQFDPAVVEAFCGLEALAEIRNCVDLGYCGPRPSRPAHPGAPASFADLVAEAKADPVFTAAVLRRANVSAAVAADIGAACDLLGEGALRAVGQSLTRVAATADAGDLRRHSLLCATAAEQLAARTQIIPPPEAYTLGLLHDVGELLLRDLFPAEMENILWLPASERNEREIAAFGVDHCQVGRWILEACGLPRRLTSAVQSHHDAPRAGDTISLLLYAADALALAAETGDSSSYDALAADRLATLRLTRGDLADLRARVLESVEDDQETTRDQTAAHAAQAGAGQPALENFCALADWH